MARIIAAASLDESFPDLSKALLAPIRELPQPERERLGMDLLSPAPIFYHEITARLKNIDYLDDQKKEKIRKILERMKA